MKLDVRTTKTLLLDCLSAKISEAEPKIMGSKVNGTNQKR